MKDYTSADGHRRLYYTDEEIERICEDELDRAGLRPTLAAPVTNLEQLIESHLKASLDQYADLPADVLGMTQFIPGERPAVSINAELSAATDENTAAPGLVGRWRATMAHETAHILLHRYLFEPDLDQLQLFPTPDSVVANQDRLMRCLKRDIGEATTSDWREVQANRGMAALLMPRTLFKRVTFQTMSAAGVVEVMIGSAAAQALAAEVAAVFQVSKQAAAIRLETLKITRPPAVAGRIPGL